MTHIAVLDKHPIVRRGLAMSLAREGDMAVTVEAATGAELLEKLEREPCAAILLDIPLPDIPWPDLLSRLQSNWPALPAIVFSANPASEFAAPAIQAGAAAYLTKEIAIGELVSAIRNVAAGREHIAADRGEDSAIGPAPESQKEEAAPWERILSPREREVLSLYAAGKTLTAIAARIGVNARTVGTYKARLLGKLGLKTNADLIAYCIRNRAL